MGAYQYEPRKCPAVLNQTKNSTPLAAEPGFYCQRAFDDGRKH